MSSTKRVVVLGSSGFVGSAVCHALARRGVEVKPVKTPRLAARPVEEAATIIDGDETALEALVQAFRGCDVVVNCAGDPDASSQDTESLVAANASLPSLVARAAVQAGSTRLVHVSSAVVQGRRPILDETFEYDTFSPYSQSKAMGERLLLKHAPGISVVYRPPSVHAPSRRVTKMTTRIARSWLSSVVAPGTQPTPQALIENVADAIAFLAVVDLQPPSVVIHPHEGLTTRSLLELLGGRRPHLLPPALASAILGPLRAASRVFRFLAPQVRRVEMIWLGQYQAESWLTTMGWTPPCGLDAWKAMGDELGTTTTNRGVST